MGCRVKRPIHLVTVDTKTRPAVILTRETVRPYRSMVTVAPITSTERGLATEVPVDPLRNGIDHESVILTDNIATVPVKNVGQLVGYLTGDQNRQLAQAIITAFDLEG